MVANQHAAFSEKIKIIITISALADSVSSMKSSQRHNETDSNRISSVRPPAVAKSMKPSLTRLSGIFLFF